MSTPKPVGYVHHEGEIISPWSSPDRPKNVHAVLFNDGRIFDMINGWRDRLMSPREMNRLREERLIDGS